VAFAPVVIGFLDQLFLVFANFVVFALRVNYVFVLIGLYDQGRGLTPRRKGAKKKGRLFLKTICVKRCTGR